MMTLHGTLPVYEWNEDPQLKGGVGCNAMICSLSQDDSTGGITKSRRNRRLFQSNDRPIDQAAETHQRPGQTSLLMKLSAAQMLIVISRSS